MRKIVTVCVVLVAGFLFADSEIPELGIRSVLKYYPGPFDGTKLMPFHYICDYYPTQLRILRNEILAKYGRPFKSRDLRGYFQATSWYRANPAYHDGLLTAIDQENIQRVLAMENMATENFGLLADLKKGAHIHAQGAEFSAYYDSKENKYVFVLDEKSHSPENVVFDTDIEKRGGYHGFHFFFRYKQNICIIVGEPGMRDIYYSKAILFRYNSKTKTINGVTIEGES